MAGEAYVAEMWHGPTLAFKDLAMQFVGEILDYFLLKRKKVPASFKTCSVFIVGPSVACTYRGAEGHHSGSDIRRYGTGGNPRHQREASHRLLCSLPQR